MKRYLNLFLALLPVAAACSCGPGIAGSDTGSVTEYVTTLTGTLSEYALSAGNTYPATAMPWGMNFWTPQTGKMGDGWIYRYDAHTIRGFRQTHQPSPWINDYGQFAIMPVKDRSLVDQDSRQSWFSHKSETAKPWLYSVYLADHDIKAELTPTDRAVMFRLRYPQSETSAIVIDAFDGGSHIEVLPDGHTVVGYTTKNSGGVPDNFRNWFIVQSDRQFEYIQVYDGEKAVDGRSVTGSHAIAVVGFATSKAEHVTLRVASSFISPEQARINMKELDGKDFDAIAKAGRDRWESVLSRIRVSGGSVDQHRTFYSCLYRSLLFPRKFYEIDKDGKIMHYSPYNGEVLEGYMYTDTGFWDTFRSLFPLLNLVYPSVNAEIQQGLANTAKESGFLPEWASPGHRGCMIGNNSASVVADAALKGVNVEELDVLYDAIVHGTENVHPQVSSTGRLGHEYYNTIGYVPYDAGINENVARTLEYAYDDWCIYMLSKKLDRPSQEQRKWKERAFNYKNVYDPSVSLMRGRNRDGSFQEPFSPYKWGDAFTEGNAWHYTWSVFHDIQGLANLMGGDGQFALMLDSVFVVPPVYDDSYYGIRIHEITEMQVADMGNYAHGNQPAQHMIYLYNYVSQPWKCQYHVRDVMDRLYSADPDGYCGDEDNGQTSAWYVFSALGFYPVCPASDEYVLGSPLFSRAEISLENGNTVSIIARDNCPSNRYISSMTLNGSTWDRNYIRYSDMISGADIRFVMSDTPNMQRGTSDLAKPYSLSRDND